MVGPARVDALADDILTLEETDSLLFVTGAGVSLASGIPTFRGADPDAVWAKDTTSRATYQFFSIDPVSSWVWYLSRFEALVGALSIVEVTEALIVDAADLAEAEALRQKIRARALDLLDTWEVLAHEQHKVGAGLQYAQEAGGAPPLLYQPTDPELLKKPPPVRKFKAARSLRDVEPSVNLWVENPDGAFLDPVGEAEGSK